MKFENTAVWGFEHAIRGMRNPKESWAKSDSVFDDRQCPIPPAIRNDGPCYDCKLFNGFGKPCYPYIGPADLNLMQTLIKSGPEHRKFLRQIFVSVDITGPLYWYKEFDTYKIGTVANSTSTMHKIQSKPISIELFETGDYDPDLVLDMALNEDLMPMKVRDAVEPYISFLENLRKMYLQTKDKKYWKELIRWLPESWLQTRTCTMNYENLLSMCSKGQRRFHKLTEWSGPGGFVEWARTLPYAQELIFLDELEN